jgi:NAD(P)-dependent dehydrogenase (short-subunit alcohol dehydrogenase family)
MAADHNVAVVTGASRGAGRGIAIALGAAGWRVYVSGRAADALERTAQDVTDRGGFGIPVPTDHSDDGSTARLFARIATECGRLDLLVNNAASVHEALVGPAPFWQRPIELADILDVGLRSHYIASWHAAPLLLNSARGLVAFTSSPGSGCYMHGPAYGAQKAGIDKLAADMAVDFRGTAVSTISIWLGILLTERMRRAFGDDVTALENFSRHAETPGFTGHVIDAVYRDPDVAGLTGRTFYGAELAQRYRITDVDGRTPPSHRDTLGAPKEPHPAIVR